jgi:DNA-binding transcriptional LysR family regulator
MTTAMDWSDVRIFLAVARAGSLSGAAQRLGLSQPTMGRRLRALEEAVGQALFQRGREGFTLTDEGSAVLAHAQRMEDEALAIERALAGHGQALQGVLRVSASDWFGAHLLTPVCAEFMRRHPQVHVELLTDARVLDLARREADLVFRIKPPDDAELVRRRLMTMDYALYGPEGVAPPVPGDGSGTTLVTLDAAYETLPDVAWLKKTFPRARLGFGSNSREAQARMVALGAGFAVLPVRLASRIPGLVAHDVAGAPPSREIWAAYHRDLRGLARLRSFLDLAVELLGPRVPAPEPVKASGLRGLASPRPRPRAR